MMARFKVHFAGPLVSFQDRGRIGSLRFGVTGAGPMDRFAYEAVHSMLGQKPGGTVIEISLGGLILECVEGEVTVALAGGGFLWSVGSAPMGDGWQVMHVRQGDKITIRGGGWGSWCYLGFSGEPAVDPWLGSTATHAISGLGGGLLTAGLQFDVQNAELRGERIGAYDCPLLARPLGEVRVVLGPQEHRFAPGMVEVLCSEPFALTDGFDRMGVRLDGPELRLGDALSIPSEPLLRGSLQVSGEQIVTVLLADHHTMAGYPKIATVIGCDVDRLSQLRAGDQVRFRAVRPEEAVAAVREHAGLVEAALDSLAAPRLALDERLMQLNLISGVVG